MRSTAPFSIDRKGYTADSDEAGHAFRGEAGHPFRWKAATLSERSDEQGSWLIEVAALVAPTAA